MTGTATYNLPTEQTLAEVAQRGYALPMQVQADLVQLSTVRSQFLMDGDIIERKGVVIEIVTAERFDDIRQVGFAYYNELGGIVGGTIPFDVDVPLFTEV